MTDIGKLDVRIFYMILWEKGLIMQPAQGPHGFARVQAPRNRFIFRLIVFRVKTAGTAIGIRKRPNGTA